MFIWNGEKLAFNFLDADMMKKFNDASKEMWKELGEYEEKNVKKRWNDGSRRRCKRVRNHE